MESARQLRPVSRSSSDSDNGSGHGQKVPFLDFHFGCGRGPRERAMSLWESTRIASAAGLREPGVHSNGRCPALRPDRMSLQRVGAVETRDGGDGIEVSMMIALSVGWNEWRIHHLVETANSFNHLEQWLTSWWLVLVGMVVGNTYVGPVK